MSALLCLFLFFFCRGVNIFSPQVVRAARCCHDGQVDPWKPLLQSLADAGCSTDYLQASKCSWNHREAYYLVALFPLVRVANRGQLALVCGAAGLVLEHDRQHALADGCEHVIRRRRRRKRVVVGGDGTKIVFPLASLLIGRSHRLVCMKV